MKPTGANWNKAEQAIRGYADLSREIMPATVVDITGIPDSWLIAQVGSEQKRVLWPDNPDPTIGQAIQVWRCRHQGSSDWLALQIPNPSCQGFIYASLRLLSGTGVGTYIVARLDLTLLSWEFRSIHPAGGAHHRRPLVGWPSGNTLITWDTAEDATSVGGVWRSTDAGLTWTSVASGFHDVTIGHQSGEAYAVDGSNVYQTLDYGATWSPFFGAPPGGGTWRTISFAPSSSFLFGLAAVATSGGYFYGTDPFTLALTMVGPFRPAITNYYPPVLASDAAFFYWRPQSNNILLAYGAVGTSNVGGYEVPGDTMTDSVSFDSFTGPQHEPWRPAVGNLRSTNTSPTFLVAYDGSGGGVGSLGSDNPGHAFYENDTQHPTGLTGIGALAACEAFASLGPPFFTATHDCLLIGLDDTTTATAKFVLRNNDHALTFTVADGNMRSILAGTYIVSMGGLTNLDLDGRFR